VNAWPYKPPAALQDALLDVAEPVNLEFGSTSFAPERMAALAYAHQGLPLLHGLAGLDLHASDSAGPGGPEFILHLHRLEDDKYCAFLNLLPLFHAYGNDQAGHRSFEVELA